MCCDRFIPLADESTSDWLGKLPGWYSRGPSVFCYEIDDCMWGLEVDVGRGVVKMECAEYSRPLPKVSTREDLAELVNLLRESHMQKMEV